MLSTINTFLVYSVYFIIDIDKRIMKSNGHINYSNVLVYLAEIVDYHVIVNSEGYGTSEVNNNPMLVMH